MPVLLNDQKSNKTKRVARAERKLRELDSCFLILKIIGVSTYCGMSKNGKLYSLYTLEVDFNGEKCKIKTFESGAAPGDYAQVGISTRKGVYGCELVVAVEKIIPASEIEGNFA